MKQTNKNSARRKGDDYQDIWGLYYIGKWLQNPDVYRWIQYECTLQEKDNTFFLDDIVLCHSTGMYSLYQIKHKQEPIKNPWTWKALLAKETASTSDKKSLLEKWSSSISSVGSYLAIAEAAFITNGQPEPAIGELITNETIDFQKMRIQQPATFHEIVNQLGSESKAQEFFSVFRFRFNQLSVDELDDKVQNFFTSEIRSTDYGYKNLFYIAKRAVRQKHITRFKYEEIIHWADFDSPRELDEDFPVPQDFQLFDIEQHKKIIRQLATSKGGCKLIIGKPGVGKSTYLAKLSQILADRDQIIIKHHFHLEPGQDEVTERVNARRIVEALKAQCKKYTEALGELSGKNSAGVEVREYLGALAKFGSHKQKPSVLIIDGIDHALHYGEQSEIRRLLNDVCVPQVGLWIIIGTQESAVNSLPKKILEIADTFGSLLISGFSLQSVEQITRKHSIFKKFPQRKNQRDEIIKELFNITEGNPLHLRYCLKELETKLKSNSLHYSDIRALAPYAGNLEQYYSMHWKSLGAFSRSLLILIGMLDYPLPAIDFLSVASHIAPQGISLTAELDAISHLLADSRSHYKIFHNSLERFVCNQIEFGTERELLSRQTLHWLESRPNSYLAWLLTPRLAYSLGNPEPLLSINRGWLIEAIQHPRNLPDIESLLALAAAAAAAAKQYAKWHEVSFLLSRCKSVWDFAPNAIEFLWTTAYEAHLNPTDIPINLHSSTPRQLVMIANQRAAIGPVEHFGRQCIDRLNLQLNNSRIYKKGEIGGAEAPLTTSCSLKIVALSDNHSPSKILEVVRSYSEYGWSEDLLATYSQTLAEFRKFSLLRELASLKLRKNELRIVLKSCAISESQLQLRTWTKVLSRRTRSIDNETALILFCNGIQNYSTIRKRSIELPTAKSFPATVNDFDSENREPRANLFKEVFSAATIGFLTNRRLDITLWIDQHKAGWNKKALSSLVQFGEYCAIKIQTGQKLDTGELFSAVKALKQLTFENDRNQIELQHSFGLAILKISELVFKLNGSGNTPSLLSSKSFNELVALPQIPKYALFAYLAKSKTPWTTSSTCAEWLNRTIAEINENVDIFSERAELFADLAQIAKNHDCQSEYNYTKTAIAEHLLGYGYGHGDLFWYEIIESIRYLFSKTSDSTLTEPLLQMSSHIDYVQQYNSGRGLELIEESFTTALAEISIGMAKSRYNFQETTENWFDAEKSFAKIISQIDFEHDKIASFLASTAIESTSLVALEDRANKSPFAKEALNELTTHMHRSSNIELEYETNKSSNTKGFDFDHDGGIEPKTVKPSQLKRYLDTLDYRTQNLFLEQWTITWTAIDQRKCAKTLLSIVDLNDLGALPAVILDAIAPDLIFTNSETGFQALCHAQANSYGWSWQLQPAEPLERRWSMLKSFFPKRHHEFMIKSLQLNSQKASKFDSDNSYFSFLLLTGIKFLAWFEELKLSREIIDTSINFGKELCKAQMLAKAEWATEEISSLDLILSRLSNRGPLVRERAAAAIAALLAKNETQTAVCEKIIEFLQKEKLESVENRILCCLLRATELNTELKATNLLNSFRGVGQQQSITKNMFINFLDNKTDVLANSNTDSFLMIRSRTYEELSCNLIQHWNKYVPYKIASSAHKLGEDLFAAWICMTADIAIENGLQLDFDSYASYRGGQNRHLLSRMTPRITDAFITAYIRISAYQNRNAPTDFRIDSAAKAFPTDVSYWRSHPGSRSKSWPVINRQRELTPEKLLGAAKIILSRQLTDTTENGLLAMQGPLVDEKQSFSQLTHTRFSIRAFGYKIVGNKIPTPMKVIKHLEKAAIICIPTQMKNPFGILDNSNHWIPVCDDSFQAVDWEIIPLVAQLETAVGSEWQPFRELEPPVFTTPTIMERPKISYAQGGWDYQNQVSKIEFRSWIENMEERRPPGCDWYYGHHLKMNKLELTNKIKDLGLQLGYVFRLETRSRINDWDAQFTQNDQYDFIL